MDDPEPRRRSRRSTSTTKAKQACDKCRLRKVRCEVLRRPGNGLDGLAHDGHSSPSWTQGGALSQCQRCESLKSNCTFDIPVKARGPRPKVASSTAGPLLVFSPLHGHSSGGLPNGSPSISREIQAAGISPASKTTATPGSPYYGCNLRLVHNNRTYSTDGICHRQLIEVILNDFLELLYPLIPVIHRPTFRRDLERNRDSYDDDFRGLIVALCAVLIATMPRKFEEYHRHEYSLRFQTRTEMVNFCWELIQSTRKPDYFDEIGHRKWTIAYLLYLSYHQIGQNNRSRMFEVEAMQLARLLDLHIPASYDGLNCIETQLRKKAFWLMIYGYVHSQLQNLRKEKLTYLEPRIFSTIKLQELMPHEIDDEWITEEEVLAQPESTVSLTAGFNIASRVFWASLTASTASPSALQENDSYCSCTHSSQPDVRLSYLRARLHDVKYVLDGVPNRFRQWKATNPAPPAATDRPGEPLHAQFETIRINIQVTHLWLQSLIFEQISELARRGSAPPRRESVLLWREREDICRQLLHVVCSVPHDHLEPNGNHLTHKIREIAASLLLCPFAAHEREARRARDYLQEFTAILSRLDGSEVMNTINLRSWVDADRRA